MTNTNIQNVKPLEQIIKRNGFSYHQVTRNKKVAIYEQRGKDNSISGYEVFLIKVLPDRKIKNTLILSYEKFPSNEDFGKTAWFYHTLDKAVAKMTELTNS